MELATDRGTRLCRENGLFALPPYTPHSLNARAPYTLVSLCVSKELTSPGNLREARAAAGVLLRRAVGRPEAERRLLEGLSVLSGERGQREGPLAGLRERLETEPELPCSLEDMAMLACMSKYRLIRAFRREARLTPHQFQLQNRVRKGQRLLGAVVGDAVGINNAAIRAILTGISSGWWGCPRQTTSGPAGRFLGYSRAGMNFANRQSPSGPAVTSWSSPWGRMETTPGA